MLPGRDGTAGPAWGVASEAPPAGPTAAPSGKPCAATSCWERVPGGLGGAPNSASPARIAFSPCSIRRTPSATILALSGSAWSLATTWVITSDSDPIVRRRYGIRAASSARGEILRPVGARLDEVPGRGKENRYVTGYLLGVSCKDEDEMLLIWHGWLLTIPSGDCRGGMQGAGNARQRRHGSGRRAGRGS